MQVCSSARRRQFYYKFYMCICNYHLITCGSCTLCFLNDFKTKSSRKFCVSKPRKYYSASSWSGKTSFAFTFNTQFTLCNITTKVVSSEDLVSSSLGFVLKCMFVVNRHGILKCEHGNQLARSSNETSFVVAFVNCVLKVSAN